MEICWERAEDGTGIFLWLLLVYVIGEDGMLGAMPG